MSTINIGLQLYTVKDLLDRNFEKTLEKICNIGYEGIELYKPVSKTILDKFPIKILGTMFDFELLKSFPSETVDYCKSVNCSTMIIPSIENQTKIEDIQKIDENCKKHDMNLLLHIHGNEFENDFLYHLLDSTNINIEIDTYWVQAAKVNLVNFMKNYADRSPYIHLKDMKANGKDTEVGTGIIDFLTVINIGKNFGCKWFIVEQEQFDIDVLESIKISYNNVKNFSIFSTNE